MILIGKILMKWLYKFHRKYIERKRLEGNFLINLKSFVKISHHPFVPYGNLSFKGYTLCNKLSG